MSTTSTSTTTTAVVAVARGNNNEMKTKLTHILQKWHQGRRNERAIGRVREREREIGEMPTSGHSLKLNSKQMQRNEM